MSKISVNFDLTVPNGPKLRFNQSLEAEGIDTIEITVPAGVNDKEVQLQPGAAGQVELLVIGSDLYDPQISYKVNKNTASPHALDQPHVFLGKGAASILDAGALASLFFSNATAGPQAKDVSIQILVARDATP